MSRGHYRNRIPSQLLPRFLTVGQHAKRIIDYTGENDPEHCELQITNSLSDFQNDAAFYGCWKELRYYVNLYYESIDLKYGHSLDPKIQENTARNCNLRMLQWLVKTTLNIPESIYAIAAEIGNIGMLQWLQQAPDFWSSREWLRASIEYSHLDVIEWGWSSGRLRIRDLITAVIAYSRDLQPVIWFTCRFLPVKGPRLGCFMLDRLTDRIVHSSGYCCIRDLIGNTHRITVAEKVRFMRNAFCEAGAWFCDTHRKHKSAEEHS